MASLVTLFCDCMESLKSIVTSQDFGAEYEILCTELSVQWLRIRLWGQSVGLHIDGVPHLQSSIFNHPEIESTVTQIVNSVAFLLSEIEIVRRRYELRPRLIPEPCEDEKTNRDSKLRSSLFRPARHLQQRMRDNQKQKSFLAIAKWAICDAKRFGEKVKRLKNLIDGLEDISKAANLIQSSPSGLSVQLSNTPDENPPPYSFDSPAEHDHQVQAADPVYADSPPDLELVEHHAALKQFSSFFASDDPPRPRALDKLLELQDKQLKELRWDVFDELCRRQQGGTVPPFLAPVATYHTKRNKARQKISTLPTHRFAHLVTDLVIELEARFPCVRERAQRIGQAVSTPNHLARPFSFTTRRHGCIPPRHSPPPLLRHRASHSTANALDPPVLRELQHLVVPPPPPPPPAWPSTRNFSRHSQSSTTLGQCGGSPYPPPAIYIGASLEVGPSTPTFFKYCQVNVDDPAWKVIPLAMQKYNIEGPWKAYSLYISYGNAERRLELDEKPLSVFKSLWISGQTPVFMLRKSASTDGEGDVEL